MPQQGYPQQYPQAPPAQVIHTAGYNPSPYPGEIEKPKASLRKPVLVTVAIIMVLLVAVVAVKVYEDSRNVISPSDKQPTTANTYSPGADIVKRSDGKLDLSQRITPSSYLKQQAIKANANEQINLSSGFSYMVTGAKTYTPTDTTLKPTDGKKFIAVSIVVGDRTQTDSISVSYLDFTLRDGHNQTLTPDSATLKVLNNFLANPNALGPGDQINGTVIFQVDSSAVQWSVVHVENYQKTTDGSSFSVEGDVNVVLDPVKTSSDSTTTTSGTAN